MTLSIDTTAANSNQQPDLSQVKDRKQAFSDLSNALGSGDLTGAQQAFSKLQQASSGRTPKGPMGSDLSDLQKALEAGDLSGAQSAFSKLQQDMQSARANHKGHHRDHDGDRGSSAAPTPSSAISSSAATSTASSGVDIKV